MKKLQGVGEHIILKVYKKPEEEKKTILIINPQKEEVQFYEVVSSEYADLIPGTLVMIKGFPISCEYEGEKYHIVEKRQIIAYLIK